MAEEPRSPELAHWARLIREFRWAAFLLDEEFRLVWTSPDIDRFLGSPPREEIGYGLPIFQVFAKEPWRRIATPESRFQLAKDLAPYLRGDSNPGEADLRGVSERVATVLQSSEPKPFTEPIATSVEYVEPGGDPDLPVMRVNVLVVPIRNEKGALLGVVGLGYMSVRPGLVSLLARGDEEMYERMAKLVEPSSRAGAILFCDLQGSTELARSLPSSQYFRLIRSLWTEIDSLVADNKGIVGKHAGDGATAFFLVDDLGSSSEAARAAIRSARTIHERSGQIFGDVLDASCLMRVGLHWGSSLYIGQLVPGGRLDVTALGDPVNECARIQETAEPHGTLASKELIERLTDDHAASLGIDPEKIRYRQLSELPGVGEKARADAGGLSVATL